MTSNEIIERCFKEGVVHIFVYDAEKDLGGELDLCWRFVGAADPNEFREHSP